MEKARVYLGFAAIGLLLQGAIAYGDFDETVKRLWSTPTIVASQPGLSASDGYVLVTYPAEVLAAKMELTEPDRLENAYFKVVEDESNEALPFTDFDGRNVLFHLTDARNYFKKLADRTGISTPALDHKVTVRVRVTHEVNPFSHFGKREAANNSSYMPFAGNQQEIWFFQRKKRFRNFDLYSFLTTQGFALVSHAYANLGINAALEGIRDYDGGIDTAKIPNVIYHEAFHWATDAPGFIQVPWQGFPTAEDFANYFASSHYGKPRVADLGEYSGRFYKRDYRKVKDLKDIRASTYNSMAFVPALLWQFRNAVGAERADLVIWSAIPLLRESVSEVDLRAALIDAIRKAGSLTVEEKAKALALIQKHSQNFEILDKIFGNKPLPPSDRDPAQRADAMTDEAVVAGGVEQAEALRELPAELKGMGFPLDSGEEKLLQQTIAQLKSETKKKGFKSKVVSALKKIGKPLAKVGITAAEGVGFLGEAVQAAATVPVLFGTDFFTGLILGHGRLSDAKPGVKPGVEEDIIGAAGGVGTFYYANSGLQALGHGYNGPVSSTGMGVVVIDQILCSRRSARILLDEERQHPTELQKYCERIQKLTGAIRRGAAKAGAASGKFLRPGDESK